VRVRGVVAAGAGIAVAVAGHTLDARSALPFVHEAASVRLGLAPWQVALWLAATGVLAAVAATTRLIAVGVPVAVVVSAAPELIARHDPGAIAEPSAVLGATLQLLLFAAVVALSAVLERRAPRLSPPLVRRPVHRRPLPMRSRSWCVLVDTTAVPRAPPVVWCS
jgi:hypothetical protein